MRRPLKPFVTEYRQSGRRSQTLPTEQSTIDGDRHASRSFDQSPRQFDPLARPLEPTAHDADDSYEAAMRAADALFSSPPNRTASAAPEAEAASDPSRAGERAMPEKAGGRILRVIDEQPFPELAALEAERAPKRRGRKPGSKNKPKVAAGAAEDAAPISLALDPTWSIGGLRPPARLASVKVAALNSQPNGASIRRDASKRFAWVKDDLRPGEDWKRRRLPRICW